MVELDFPNRQEGTGASSASDSGLETPSSNDPLSVPDVSEPSEEELGLRQYEPSFMRKLASRTKTKTGHLNFLFDILRQEDKGRHT